MDNNEHDQEPERPAPPPTPAPPAANALHPQLDVIDEDWDMGMDHQPVPVPPAGINFPIPAFRSNARGGFPFPTALRPLNQVIRVFSTDLYNGPDVNYVECGGKIILPPSYLDHLTRLNITYPLVFRITNNLRRRVSHCGVLEFTAEEDGRCYMPKWMMRNLELDEGDRMQIESISLPTATFCQFEPQTVDFLEITNPKAVLENSLRHFACLTKGDIISIQYNHKIIDFRVLETKPANAVTIIECDLNVDFAPPVGYVEPEGSRKSGSGSNEPVSGNYAEAIQPAFSAFTGTGNRMDGKPVDEEKEVSSSNGKVIRGIPDYDWEVGSIDFVRDLSIFGQGTSGQANGFVPFGGSGSTLKTSKTNK